MKLLLMALFACITLTVKSQTADSLRRDTTVYNEQSVAIKPQFPGGENKLSIFLTKTIRYPAHAREHNIQGKVMVSFIVEKDGTLTHFKITKTVADDLDAETIRVFKLSPKWEPAKINRQPVRSLHIQPCSYTLG
ncbi:MAG: energy transducer TonB [Bacteroidota bacterium]